MLEIAHKKRNSGVELYKIIAMMLICFSHSVQTGLEQIILGNSFIDYILFTIFAYFGQMGNIIFIICSSYFLIDSKNNEAKSNKVIKILFDSSFISITIFLCFLISGYQFSFQNSIVYFFPDIFFQLWFIPIYVLFYMIHPFINAALRNINRRTHFVFCVITLFFYGIGGLFFNWAVGINELARFIMIYILVAYCKKYHMDLCKNKRVNAITAIISGTLFFAIAAGVYYFKWNNINLVCYYSPLMFALLFSLFNLFNGLKFHSKSINFLASLSLFFYCIHENSLIRGILRVGYYDYVLSISPNYAVWVFLCFVIWFVGGFLLAIIYKLSFSKLTNLISKRLGALFDKFIDWLLLKTKTNESYLVNNQDDLENQNNNVTSNKDI